MSSISSALAAMKALRTEIESRLLRASEDYRALVALDKAIEQVSPPHDDSYNPPPSTEIGRAMQRVGERMLRKPPTQPDATAAVLEKYGPQPTAVILERIGELGVEVSGGDPLINLSSSISKSSRFRSIRINGVPHWWFKDRELPAIRTDFSLDFGAEAGAAAPAADDNAIERGGENGDAAA